MSESEAIQEWKDSAVEDLELSDELFESGRNHHSLFFLHLAIEKLLKALHQHQKHEPAPYIHDLSKLAAKVDFDLDTDTQNQLDEITTYNVSARYGWIKKKLFEKSTAEYTEKWKKIGKELFTRFLSLLP